MKKIRTKKIVDDIFDIAILVAVVMCVIIVASICFFGYNDWCKYAGWCCLLMMILYGNKIFLIERYSEEEAEKSFKK